MQTRSPVFALVATLLAACACIPFPLHAQSASRFDLQSHRLLGPVRLDPRPIFAPALIGGLIGLAVSGPYRPAQVPQSDDNFRSPLDARWSQQSVTQPAHSSVSRAPSIAEGWQQFGELRREENRRGRESGAQFTEHWQRFFEPLASNGGLIQK